MKKKYIATALGLIMCASMAIYIGTENYTVSAFADTTLTVEDYTKSDNLLRADGLQSGKTIQSFATQVKSAAIGTDCSEITQVIPTTFMETSVTMDEYFYNGKEYGFYIVKEGNYFDLLLIDFIYDFGDGITHNNEYKIRIQPILQQSFLRTESNGEYQWVKCSTDTRYKYYVANPSFSVELKNENALNYGDDGYDKHNDTGLIIQQSRANYGKISYKTEKDYWEETLKFTGKTVVEAIVDTLDIADILGYVDTAIAHEKNMYNLKQEVVLEANNEGDICTELSRQEQYDDESIDGYSRSVSFAPKEEIILSDDSNSYAELITLLNDTNSRSRLTQRGSFHIVRRCGDWSSMEYVRGDAENAENKVFSLFNEKVLFNDTSITTLSDKPYTQAAQAYFLPNGTHQFRYTAPTTTTYQITAPQTLADVTIYEEGSENEIACQKVNNTLVEFNLVAGKTYRIKLSQSEKGFYDITLKRKSEPIYLDTEIFIKALSVGESTGFDYTAEKDGYVNFLFDETIYDIAVYMNENKYLVALTDINDGVEFSVRAGNTYYIEITNAKGTALPSNSANFYSVIELDVNQISKSFPVFGNRRLRVVAPASGWYKVDCFDTTIVNAAFENAVSSNNEFYLNGGTEYYICLSGTDLSTRCMVSFVSNDIEVDGGNITLNGGGKTDKFVKFTPKETATYAMTLPSGVQATHLIDGDSCSTTFSLSNLTLTQGKDYYFRLYSPTQLPDTFNVQIAPKLAKSITVSNGETSMNLSGNGVVWVCVDITDEDTANSYEIIGLENIQVYDRYMNRRNNTALSYGKYYIKANLVAGNNYTMRIMPSGIVLQVGDVVNITSSSTYKFEDLVVGEEYKINIGTTNSSTIVANIEIYTYNGTTSTIQGKVGTFIAEDTVSFVKVTLTNVNGHAGIFVLEQSETLDATHIQNISINNHYSWNTVKNGKYFKLPAGSYSLYVHKKSGENVDLWNVSSNDWVQLTETTQQEGTLEIYTLNISADTVYLIQTDQIEASFVVKDNNGEYILVVEDEDFDEDTLLRGNNYTFALMYRSASGNFEKVEKANMSFFDAMTGNTQISPANPDEENLYYNFYQYEAGTELTVFVDYFGITASCEMIIVSPTPEAQFVIEQGSIYFKAYTFDYDTNSGFEFDRMRLQLVGDSNFWTEEYTTQNISIDLNDYGWCSEWEMNVIYCFSDGTNSFDITQIYNKSIKTVEVTSKEPLDGYDSAIVTAKAQSGNTYNANNTIAIPSSISVIYFDGRTNQMVTNFNIDIDSRSTPLFIYMKNFSYKYTEMGLDNPTRLRLTLNITGDCKIVPMNENDGKGIYGIYSAYLTIEGSGSLEVQASKQRAVTGNTNPRDGVDGICCNSAIISIKKLKTVGGAGGDAGKATGTEYADELRGKSGNYGSAGGYGLWCAGYFTVTNDCQELIFVGGQGGRGGDGADGLDGTGAGIAGGRGGFGGDGGAGGDSFHNNLSNSTSIASSVKVTYTEGKHGNGGNGGNGGDGGAGAAGGHGGNGGDGWQGGIGGNGGHGGNGKNDTSTDAKASAGGNGGNGGRGGWSEQTNTYERPGNGGNGGNGGSPGAIGHGKDGGNGGIGYQGGSGGDGSNSKAWFTDGGDGGDGGNGYGSLGGSGGSGGSGKSDDGKDGSNGQSYSSYQNYPHETPF